MEEELVEKYSADVTLIASDGGVFEIVVDGQCIFSKKGLGRFPHDGEIVKLING